MLFRSNIFRATAPYRCDQHLQCHCPISVRPTSSGPLPHIGASNIFRATAPYRCDQHLQSHCHISMQSTSLKVKLNFAATEEQIDVYEFSQYIYYTQGCADPVLLQQCHTRLCRSSAPAAVLHKAVQIPGPLMQQCCTRLCRSRSPAAVLHKAVQIPCFCSSATQGCGDRGALL